jgi:hypothetical protein
MRAPQTEDTDDGQAGREAGEGQVDFCMNVYQKTATIILRIAGCALVAIGVMGLLYFVGRSAVGQSPSADLSDRLVASIVWLVSGIIVLPLSKPIGRLLGHGLD